MCTNTTFAENCSLGCSASALEKRIRFKVILRKFCESAKYGYAGLAAQIQDAKHLAR